MERIEAQNVFVPGSLPDSTYITRETKMGFTYEERLRQSLSMNGYLTVISGPSKIGKTVLCEKVVGLNSLVEMSGSDFVDKEIWTQIGIKAGMPYEGAMVTGNQSTTTSSEYYKLSKENVIEHYKNHGLVLLVDDFHYISLEIQMHMAQQFKDAIRRGFVVIIASLPHRSDDAIRMNPDLQGRINIIDIDAWSKEELSEIPLRGFEKIGVDISASQLKRLTEESIYSPQLMQLICLSICILSKTDCHSIQCIEDAVIEKAFRFSTLNLDYRKIASVIRQGKNSRGKQRKTYHTIQWGELDLYGLILEALAIDPPMSRLSFEELLKRILDLVDGEEKPTAASLKDYLKNLQELINEKGHSYEVIEWNDNSLYILESLFLFYLRWGRDE